MSKNDSDNLKPDFLLGGDDLEGGGKLPALAGKVKLVIQEGESLGKVFTLIKARNLIGRLDEERNIVPEIDLSNEDEGYVSRRHAEIRLEDEAVYIIDLGGKNKTYLNNAALRVDEPVALDDKDLIRVGMVLLRVEFDK